MNIFYIVCASARIYVWLLRFVVIVQETCFLMPISLIRGTWIIVTCASSAEYVKGPCSYESSLYVDCFRNTGGRSLYFFGSKTDKFVENIGINKNYVAICEDTGDGLDQATVLVHKQLSLHRNNSKILSPKLRRSNTYNGLSYEINQKLHVKTELSDRIILIDFDNPISPKLITRQKSFQL